MSLYIKCHLQKPQVIFIEKVFFFYFFSFHYSGIFSSRRFYPLKEKKIFQLSSTKTDKERWRKSRNCMHLWFEYNTFIATILKFFFSLRFFFRFSIFFLQVLLVLLFNLKFQFFFTFFLVFCAIMLKLTTSGVWNYS